MLLYAFLLFLEKDLTFIHFYCLFYNISKTKKLSFRIEQQLFKTNVLYHSDSE